MCVPAGSSSGGTSSGGVGCDPQILLFLVLLCPNGIDIAACDCSMGGSSSGGTSSGGTSSGGTSSGGTAVGGACTADGTCVDQSAEGPPVCLNTAPWPGGYCSAPCFSSTDCGAAGVCVNFGPDSTTGQNMVFCMAGCDPVANNGCRTGYACYSLGSGNGGFCYPRCTSNNDCNAADGYVCNMTSGRCEM